MLNNCFKRFALLLALLFAFVSCVSCTAIEKCFYPLEHEEFIREYGDLHEIPYSLLAAVIYAESKFDPDAVSTAGAVGLMQVLPQTAKELAGRMGIEYDEKKLYDPETNIAYGSYYLKYLYNNLGKNWKTALAAYNAGIGRVKSWLEDPAYSDDGVTLKSIPFKETRDYVEKIEKSKSKYKKLYFS